MISFNHCVGLVTQLGGFLGIATQHTAGFGAGPTRHDHWGWLEDNDAGREELRRRIRAVFDSGSSLIQGEERARLVREYAEAKL